MQPSPHPSTPPEPNPDPEAYAAPVAVAVAVAMPSTAARMTMRRTRHEELPSRTESALSAATATAFPSFLQKKIVISKTRRALPARMVKRPMQRSSIASRDIQHDVTQRDFCSVRYKRMSCS